MAASEGDKPENFKPQQNQDLTELVSNLCFSSFEPWFHVSAQLVYIWLGKNKMDMLIFDLISILLFFVNFIERIRDEKM